jgi:hypothetical protein
MSVASCLLAEVRLARELVDRLELVTAGLRDLLGDLGDAPKCVWATSPGGRTGRERDFSWETLDELMRNSDTGIVTAFDLGAHPTSFALSLNLRNNPEIDDEYQPPLALWLAVEVRPDGFAPSGLVEAASAWLVHCAGHLNVLQAESPC